MNNESRLPLYGVLGLMGLVAAATLVYALIWSGWVWTNDSQLDAYGVDLSANVTEKIVELTVDEGDYVKKGDLIARLESNVPRAQAEKARAEIFALEQEVLYYRADFEKKQNDYTRAVESVEDLVISAQNYDHLEKDFRMAEAQLKLSEANFKHAIEKLKVVEAELTHYEIYAPMDGIISKRWVWVGDVTTPGQSLYTMYNLSDLWVLANFDEFDIRKVKLGAKAEIHVDAYPGKKFVGKVFSINGAAASKFTLIPQNNATGNYTKVSQRIPVKISIAQDEEGLYLFPGMNVEVSIKDD